MRDQLGSENAYDRERQRQIEEVVREGLRRRAAGDSISDDSLIELNPELMPELGEELERQALLSEDSADPNAETVDTDAHHHSGSRSGHLEVRCPSCHTPTEVAVDTKLTDLRCDSCGSHYSLVGQDQSTRMAPPLSKLGRFELLERLGVGGFGSVWKARDKELDRTVAIKIPRQADATAEEQEKFFREARAAAQLRHPGIVSVHEVGRDGDSIYIVSDFVRGMTLEDWLSGQRLTSREAAELCAKIAEALHHAHEHGVVHRDLKPSNIIIDDNYEPHLMDFGLARREIGEVTVTMDGQVIGTPAYMSPEQAQGEAHRADCRSDVYSLGVILFRLLTGELPFRGNARMIMHQVINDEPPSPRKLNSSVPRDLETITLKCLEKQPAKRYVSARHVAEDLRHWMARKPIAARPISRPERAIRWIHRNPVMAILNTIIGASLLAIALLSMHTAAAIRSENNKTREALSLAQAARLEAEATAESNRRQLYSASMNLASQSWNSGTIPRLLMTLGMQRPEADQSDLRGFQWRNLWWNAAPYAMSSILRAEASVESVAYSIDGELLACGLGDGSIVVWRPANGEFIRRMKTEADSVSQVAFVADTRKLIALNGNGTIEIWDLDTGNVLTSVAGTNDELTAFAVAPEGDRFVSGDEAGSLQMWSIDGEADTVTLEGLDSNVEALAWSQDGKFIVSSHADEKQMAWNATTGEPLYDDPIQSGPDNDGALALSPNGSTIVVGCYQRFHLWNAATGRYRGRKFCHANEMLNAIAWAPDGETIATAGGDGAVILHKASNGDQIRVLRGHSGDINSLAFSPDGRRLATGGRDGSTILWDLPDLNQRDTCSLTRSRAMVTAMDFAPHDALAVASTTAGELILWDASSCEIRKLLTDAHGARTAIADVAFYPSGDEIASFDRNGGVWIWETSSMKQLHAFHAPLKGTVLDVDPARQLMAFRTGDTEVQLYHWADRETLRTLKGHSDRVLDACFSRDGKSLITVGRALPVGGEAHLWNVETGELLAEHRERRANIACVAFSQQGDLLALGLSAFDGVAEILLCDARTLAVHARLTGDASGVTTLCFTPDGQTLIAGTRNGSVRFWGVATHADQGAIDDARYALTCIEFNQAGTIAAIARRDGTVDLLRSSMPLADRPGLGGSNESLPRPVEHWPLDSGSQEAIVFYSSLVQQRSETLGADDPATLQAILLLNTAFATRGVDVWEKGYEDALAKLRKALGDENRDVLRASFKLGQIYLSRDQPLKARPVFEECVRRQTRVLGATHPETLATIVELVTLLCNDDKYDTAHKLIGDSVQQLYAASPDKMTAAFIGLGRWTAREERWPECQAYYQALHSAARPLDAEFQEFQKSEQWAAASLVGLLVLDQHLADSGMEMEAGEVTCLQVGAVLALAGDRDKYADFCDSLTQRYDESDDPLAVQRVCHACLLMPDAPNVSKLPLQKLAQLLETTPDLFEWFPPWGWGTCALAAYRDGNPALAVEYANRSDQHPSTVELGHAMNLATLAMAEYELNHLEAADRAREELAQIVARHPDYESTNNQDQLIAKILLREADAKIKDNAVDTTDPNTD